MVGVADAIGAAGIQRPYEVVEIASQVGLRLSIGCAMLKRESYGGLNLWGGDAVLTGGVYVKGSTVSKVAYLAYRELRRLGIIGNQGVGPGQLTATGYQDQADAIGGCWDWRCNVTVAFRALANLIHVYGDDGIRRYNGSGPDAENYRRAVLADAANWQRIIDASTPDVVAPSVPGANAEEDEAMYIFIGKASDDPNDFRPGGIAILSGSLLIGLGGPGSGEYNSALGNVSSGRAVAQWVEEGTFDALNVQSHNVHDRLRLVKVADPIPAPVG